jgi:hypothetical protein
MRDYKTLQEHINRVLLIAGVDGTIDYLQDYEKNHPYKKDFETANSIITCISTEMHIPKKDIADPDFRTTDCVNARRLSVYFININTNLPKKKIKALLNIGNKTFSDYITRLSKNLFLIKNFQKNILKLQPYGRKSNRHQ